MRVCRCSTLEIIILLVTLRGERAYQHSKLRHEMAELILSDATVAQG